MPKIQVTATKGLVQSTKASGDPLMTAEEAVKVYIKLAPSMTNATFIAADAAGADYTGGAWIALHSKTAKYQLYFSSVGGAAQTVPTANKGYQLVSIGNIAADATAGTVATAVEAAVLTLFPDLTAVATAGVVTVVSGTPGTASAADNSGTTPGITVTVVDAGSGEGTSAIRTSGIVHTAFPDAGAAGGIINFDGTGTPDAPSLTLASGAYPGQTVTFVDTVASATTIGALKLVVAAQRNADGGGSAAGTYTMLREIHTDGSAAVSLVWDGLAWIQSVPTAAATLTEYGFTWA